MKKERFLCVFFAAMLVLSMCGCGKVIGGTETSDKITILTTAMVGTATTADDPYKKYVKDHYGLDATLLAETDFSTKAQLLFSNYDDMPDVVSFTDIDSFRTIYNQGVLLSDWTPYLDGMPNFSSIVNKPDADRPGKASVARIMMTGPQGNLCGLWTLPDPPSWSLKIREDWADEYRATTEGRTENGVLLYPAGSAATNGGPWQPYAPDDLLHFARWIRYGKNANPDDPDCFGFSTAGENRNFGVLGTWIPLMYGAVPQLPWGIAFDDNGNVTFGITDGVHKKMLDFIQIIIKDRLMDPNWYYHTAADKQSFAGKTGIEWYPGEITEDTQAYFMRNNIKDPKTGEITDTTDWWRTYPVPKDPDSPLGGFQPSDGFFGQIITVSAKAANDKMKMEKICRFIDDLAMTKSVNEKGEAVYNRSEGYNALRWGVGIEDHLNFQSIEGTNQVYLYTGDEGKNRGYRSQYPGAWDWGAFFRSKDDGVIQGTSSKTVNRTIGRVVEQDALTASFVRRLQYGGILQLEPNLVTSLTSRMQAFEYRYVTDKNSTQKSREAAYEKFKGEWLAAGGTEAFKDAERQFRRIGFIK